MNEDLTFILDKIHITTTKAIFVNADEASKTYYNFYFGYKEFLHPIYLHLTCMFYWFHGAVVNFYFLNDAPSTFTVISALDTWYYEIDKGSSGRDFSF